MKTLLKNARHYSRTVLGIIALMLLLVYGHISLAIMFENNFGKINQSILVVFAVLFPFFLFAGLLWIIAKHPALLFDVKDFKSENNYISLVKVFASISEKYRHRDSDNNCNTSKNTIEDLNEYIEQLIKCVNKHSENKRILWVDDNPSNNIYERIALEELGFQIVLATSTNEAMELLHTKYAAIISDMKRKEGNKEGYVLFNRIRNKHIYTPYFIYTGYCTPEMKKEMNDKIGYTDDPKELIDMVTKSI